MFKGPEISSNTWSGIQRRLALCRLSHLQAYASWRRLRGHEGKILGPVAVFGRDRTRVYANLSGQRYAPNTSKGLDHLLPPGPGPEAHILQALQLPSPFVPCVWTEPDIEFVIDTVWIWQQWLPALGQQQRQILRTVHTALQPLAQALQAHRCRSADMVAQQKNTAFVACMTVLLRWRDTLQPLHLLKGYPIVGHVQPCGAFRPIHQDDKLLDPDEWLGPSACQDLQRLLTSRPPLFARDILDVTLYEMAKGFCGPLRFQLDLDREFGPGQWRFLERFLIVQPDGKKRVIDNGRKSGHNLHTQIRQKISTVSVDFVASVTRMLCDHIQVPMEQWEDQLRWLAVRLGTDDLPDAYRGFPVADDHLRYSNISIYVPDTGWRFTTLYGLASGLEAAVVAFNRFPQLGIAIAITRRCLVGCCAAHFDDELSVEFCKDRCVTQRGLVLAFTLMGAPPQPSKSFSPSFNRHCLGTSVHVGDLLTLGAVRFQPKSTTQWKVVTKLKTAKTSGQLDRDTAGKLRADLNWMWSMCAGHIGRLAGPLLTSKQKDDDPILNVQQLHTIDLLIDIVQTAAPRDVIVAGPTPPLVTVYSDASFEKGILRLGWVIFDHGSRPIGGTCVIPQETLDSWSQRRQQIFPGEALAALVIPFIHADLLTSKDIPWFIDNEAAVASPHQSEQFTTGCSHDLLILSYMVLQTWHESLV